MPGGLTKAVKIVYGHHNEVRASRELKALERVKQLRHPFLLSLERIEIVDGRLIIVTEMADMSLKQRFLDCQAAGQPGISRGELLSHLRDAADALDFLNASQSLQHLDVKAENLLLVGGRLKVGDFGLVRNLTECDASMLEGMTPRYAAPEVFEGRPTKFSDQFSLAVVYAELLTGLPPFDAKSPAQCALNICWVPSLGSNSSTRPIRQWCAERCPRNRKIVFPAVAHSSTPCWPVSSSRLAALRNLAAVVAIVCRAQPTLRHPRLSAAPQRQLQVKLLCPFRTARLRPSRRQLAKI